VLEDRGIQPLTIAIIGYRGIVVFAAHAKKGAAAAWL